VFRSRLTPSPRPSSALRPLEPLAGRLPPRRQIATLGSNSSTFSSGLIAASMRASISWITIRKGGLGDGGPSPYSASVTRIPLRSLHQIRDATEQLCSRLAFTAHGNLTNRNDLGAQVGLSSY
jgi:hypothetical protein